jgi:hypothetical protein
MDLAKLATNLDGALLHGSAAGVRGYLVGYATTRLTIMRVGVEGNLNLGQCGVMQCHAMLRSRSQHLPVHRSAGQMWASGSLLYMVQRDSGHARLGIHVYNGPYESGSCSGRVCAWLACKTADTASTRPQYFQAAAACV